MNTKALIDTGGEVTCVSEEFITEYTQELQSYSKAPVEGVAVKGPVGGKVIKLKNLIILNLLLSTEAIPIKFLIVSGLTRPCLIGIDVLEVLKSYINLDKGEITFHGLKGKPTIKIMSEEEECLMKIKKDNIGKDLNTDSETTDVILQHLQYDCTKELKYDLLNIKNLQKQEKKLQDIRNKVDKVGDSDKRFTLEKDILYHKSKNGLKIFLPKTVLRKLICECHEAYGHIGSKKTYKILTEQFYYPHMARIIRINLRTCDSCQRNKIPTVGSSTTMESVLPQEPLDLISIDFFGPSTR